MKEKTRPFLNLDNRQRKLAKVFERFGYEVHLPLKEDIHGQKEIHARGTEGEANRASS